MNIRQVLTLAGVILAAVLCLWGASKEAALAEPPEPYGLSAPEKNSPALVGRVHGVTMLEFTADRAIQEIRVVVNKEITGSMRAAGRDTQTNLKIATVVSEQRKSVSVFIDAPFRTEIIAAYPPLRDARDGPPEESIGPVKDAKLAESEWIEVYRLSANRYEGKDVVNFELKIEIR